MRAFDLAAVPIAVAELALARLRLARLQSSRLTAEVALEAATSEAARQLPVDIARVAYLVPRVAVRLPWRADCLVQALAARHWLVRLGHQTTLSLGSRRSVDGQFQAHAWLTWQGLIVTGGDVSDYAPFRTRDP